MSSRTKSTGLQLETPIAKYYSLARSPLLTPITGSSTYSPLPRDQSRTPFDDSPDSFEFEIKVAEDEGEYIFSIEPQFSVTTTTLQNHGLWTPDQFCPRTPDFSHSPDEDHAAGAHGSISSFDSGGPMTQPCTPDNSVHMACDSPTIPGEAHAHLNSAFEDEADMNWDLGEHNETRAMASPRKRPALTRPGSLLSPITIVLDTIQEHAIFEAPRLAPKASRRTSRMKMLPKIRSFPAIDLFNSVLDTPVSSPEPPNGPIPPTPDSVLISYASPITTRLPARPQRGNSKVKLDKLLGRPSQAPSADRASSSFDYMPFQYPLKQERAPRLYEMF